VDCRLAGNDCCKFRKILDHRWKRFLRSLPNPRIDRVLFSHAISFSGNHDLQRGFDVVS